MWKAMRTGLAILGSALLGGIAMVVWMNYAPCVAVENWQRTAAYLGIVVTAFLGGALLGAMGASSYIYRHSLNPSSPAMHLLTLIGLMVIAASVCSLSTIGWVAGLVPLAWALHYTAYTLYGIDTQRQGWHLSMVLSGTAIASLVGGFALLVVMMLIPVGQVNHWRVGASRDLYGEVVMAAGAWLAAATIGAILLHLRQQNHTAQVLSIAAGAVGLILGVAGSTVMGWFAVMPVLYWSMLLLGHGALGWMTG